MATATAPYDPLQSVEGMWNGSLIRLAFYFKNPADYGQQTQTVLRETAKRYQDALDDCEIQILEAKWYLEHQLAQNRARRAQKALENTTTTAKRKLDSMNEDTEHHPAKRTKVLGTEDSSASLVDATEIQPEQAATATLSATEKSGGGEESSIKDSGAETEAPKETADQQKPEEKPAAAATAPEKRPAVDQIHTSKPAQGDYPSQDEPKTSGPVSSTGENQDFNFDSMFDDPGDTGDPNPEGMNFDIDMDPDPFTNAMSNSNNLVQADKPDSLDSLLPGLETYANQTGDDLMMNFTSTNAGVDGNGGVSSNIFDLPDLGDSTFDDLLNDDSFGGGGMGAGGEGDDMLNDDSMMNMGDLDSFFN